MCWSRYAHPIRVARVAHPLPTKTSHIGRAAADVGADSHLPLVSEDRIARSKRAENDTRTSTPPEDAVQMLRVRNQLVTTCTLASKRTHTYHGIENAAAIDGKFWANVPSSALGRRHLTTPAAQARGRGPVPIIHLRHDSHHARAVRLRCFARMQRTPSVSYQPSTPLDARPLPMARRRSASKSPALHPLRVLADAQ